MQDSNNDILIYSNATGYGAAVVYAVCFLLFAIGPWFVIRAIPYRDLESPAPGFLAAVFGLLLLFILFFFFTNMLYALRFGKKPALVFDSRGIVDRTGPYSLGLIHWHEVEEIFCTEVYVSNGARGINKKENALGLRVRDREDILSRFGLLARFMIRGRSRPGFFIILTSDLRIGGNNISALVLKVAKAFPVKVGDFRGIKDKN